MSLDHRGCEKIDDPARPFYLLEVRNIPDFRHSTGTLYSDFLGAGINVGEMFDGEYFTVRDFLKGTVHITFKSPDLVEKLNDICQTLSRCIAATCLIQQ